MQRRLAIQLFLSFFVLGCGKGEAGKAGLPPATGPNAPPLPTLPAVEHGGAGTVAPTSGKTTGTAYAHAEAQLAPNVGGLIAQVLVTEGDRVKKGDILFRLDATDATLRRDQVRAGLEAAKVAARANRVELERTKAMFEQNAVNRAQWDQIQARQEGADAAVLQAEAALAIASKAIADATVRAPMNGVVTAKLKSEGEMATTMPPTVVLVLQDQETLDLRFRLPEHALVEIKAGDPVTARFTAIGVIRSARVARVNPTVDVRTRTVEVVAELANPELTLKPGLLAEVELGGAPASQPAAKEGVLR